MSAVEHIEGLTRAYSELRDLLSERVSAFNDELDLIKRQKLPGIRKTLAKVAEAEQKLKAALEAHPEAFVKPKTLIFHGVKVGFKKGKGKMEWSDPDMVVQLIKKHFPEQVELLIRTKETPDKQALDGLDARDLRRLGVSVEETGDVVVIKPVASDVEKMVAALLKGAENEEA